MSIEINVQSPTSERQNILPINFNALKISFRATLYFHIDNMTSEDEEKPSLKAEFSVSAAIFAAFIRGGRHE
jgi:hypothetical protein